MFLLQKQLDCRQRRFGLVRPKCVILGCRRLFPLLALLHILIIGFYFFDDFGKQHFLRPMGGIVPGFKRRLRLFCFQVSDPAGKAPKIQRDKKQ